VVGFYRRKLLSQYLDNEKQKGKKKFILKSGWFLPKKTFLAYLQNEKLKGKKKIILKSDLKP